MENRRKLTNLCIQSWFSRCHEFSQLGKTWTLLEAKGANPAERHRKNGPTLDDCLLLSKNELNQTVRLVGIGQIATEMLFAVTL
ncbi:hypothetical protein FIL92_01175 [SAR202 cluster bacterium AD-812-D07_MRT_10900m]|nr:hypothetical protein [SAR202 cluster bacterium AD-812-D07_MRT_10900m]